jgi:hypothetical protein
MKGLTRFKKRGKLDPQYIGPYEILERVDSLAYCLALPPNLSRVHNVFHVYVADPSHVPHLFECSKKKKKILRLSLLWVYVVFTSVYVTLFSLYLSLRLVWQTCTNLMRMPRTSTNSGEYDGLVGKVMRSSDYILLE